MRFLSKHGAIDAVELFLSQFDLGRRVRQPLTRYREETVPVIHLDFAVVIRLATAAARFVGLQEQLDAESGRADLRVGVKLLQDVDGPTAELTTIRIDTVIQVDAAVRIVWGEYETNAGQGGIALTGVTRLLKRIPTSAGPWNHPGHRSED